MLEGWKTVPEEEEEEEEEEKEEEEETMMLPRERESKTLEEVGEIDWKSKIEDDWRW